MKKNIHAASFSHLLMQWHLKENKRSMPWKGEKDPYKIWLSEIILQQTRVEQGMGYYLRFINKYPAVIKLAAASDDEVFKLWEGLGYYSRCKNLIATARYISQELNGIFPESFENILKLKGIGPYTAAAIASFAFNLPHAVVDGNVSRVLARYFGIHTAIDSTSGKKEFAVLAQQLLDKTAPALYNQAIMDFGATVCKPKLPLCRQCLLSNTCKAFIENSVSNLPVKEKKIIKKSRWFYYFVLELNGKYFVRKRVAKDIWQNLHEFILIEKPAKTALCLINESEEFRFLVDRAYTSVNTSGYYKQQLTHQTIHGCFIHLKIAGKKLIKGYELIDKKALAQLAFPKLVNDYLAANAWGKN